MESFLLSQLSAAWKRTLGPNALAELTLIGARLDSDYPRETIAPPPHLVMRAFEIEPDQVRVIIIGQDPYPLSLIHI